jgi:hypothetical protein
VKRLGTHRRHRGFPLVGDCADQRDPDGFSHRGRRRSLQGGHRPITVPTPTAQSHADEAWVTRHQAVAICAVSFDIIRRYIEPLNLLRSRKNA